METVAEMFKSYVRSAYGCDPTELPFTQLVEVRRAFYAGVHGMFCRSGLSKLEQVQIEEELEQFNKDVIEGRK